MMQISVRLAYRVTSICRNPISYSILPTLRLNSSSIYTRTKPLAPRNLQYRPLSSSILKMSPSVNTPSTNPGMSLTSGRTDAVWIALQPYNKWPKYSKLDKDLETHTVVVGAGMAGISTAYELVQKGIKVVLLDAREVTSGETGRTSGHLSDNLGERYAQLIKIHGVEQAKILYESHQWAIKHIGEVAEKHNIDCEYRRVPGYIIVQVPTSDPKYDEENDLSEEPDAYKQMRVEGAVDYRANGGLDLGSYDGAILELKNEATFHPLKYLHGLLGELNKKPELFSCYTNTRVRTYNASTEEVTIETEGPLGPEGKPLSNEKGHTIKATNIVLTSNIPINAVSLITKNAYYRTYCIATKIPASNAQDYLLYDNGDPYIYVRITDHPDSNYKYLVVGGEDHKVAFEAAEEYQSHYDNLIKWTTEHFPKASNQPDYAWSGQVIEVNDNAAYIGQDSTLGKNVFVSTGDCGNGLTHSVIASKIFSDILTGTENPWAKFYSPSRIPRVPTEVVKDNVEQIAQYSRYLKSDVNDIEDIPKCEGAVIRGGIKKLGKPLAVYRDEDGSVRTFSAICPHAGAVLAWNSAEKSWDCPLHGSRFDGPTGKCVFGPSNRGLTGDDDAAKQAISAESSG